MTTKMGRPTKYKPEFCDMLIEHMAQGLSFESFAAVCDVNRDQLYEWAKKHPNFHDAKKIGQSKSLLIWEKIGLNGTVGKLKNFNVGAWCFNMKNRFRWTDRISQEVTIDQNPAAEASTEDLLNSLKGRQ